MREKEDEWGEGPVKIWSCRTAHFKSGKIGFVAFHEHVKRDGSVKLGIKFESRVKLERLKYEGIRNFDSVKKGIFSILLANVLMRCNVEKLSYLLFNKYYPKLMS